MQESSAYSSVHKVYSKLQVWLFDNNTFPQDPFLDTATTKNEAETNEISNNQLQIKEQLTSEQWNWEAEH